MLSFTKINLDNNIKDKIKKLNKNTRMNNIISVNVDYWRALNCIRGTLMRTMLYCYMWHYNINKSIQILHLNIHINFVFFLELSSNIFSQRENGQCIQVR